MAPVSERGIARIQNESLQRWITEISTEVSKEDDQEEGSAVEAGIAEDLYIAASEVFDALLKSQKPKSPRERKYKIKLKTGLETFILWGDGFENGRLDLALSRSVYLKLEILAALSSIAKLLLRTAQNLPSSASYDASIKTLRGFLEKAEKVVAQNRSADSESESSGIGTEQESEVSLGASSRAWTAQLCRDMKYFTTCLMDLAFSINQTLDHVDLDGTRIQTQQGDSFEVSGPAQVYVSNVRDKFRKADLKLVQRMGQANWQRYNRIRFQLQGENVSVIEEKAQSVARAFSLFHDSGYGASLAYAQSVVSHSSLASSFAGGERSTWRVPPLPIDAVNGKSFLCTTCGQVLHNIKNRIDWKYHVFLDLQPYICTFSVCRSQLVTFPNRKIWAEHEFSEHRIEKTWICPSCSEQFKAVKKWEDHLHYQHNTIFTGPLALVAINAAEKRQELLIKDQKCPFCLELPATTKRKFIQHVGQHMEQVALAVLPREDDSDISEADLLESIEEDEKDGEIRKGSLTEQEADDTMRQPTCDLQPPHCRPIAVTAVDVPPTYYDPEPVVPRYSPTPQAYKPKRSPTLNHLLEDPDFGYSSPPDYPKAPNTGFRPFKSAPSQSDAVLVSLMTDERYDDTRFAAEEMLDSESEDEEMAAGKSETLGHLSSLAALAAGALAAHAAEHTLPTVAAQLGTISNLKHLSDTNGSTANSRQGIQPELEKRSSGLTLPSISAQLGPINDHIKRHSDINYSTADFEPPSPPLFLSSKIEATTMNERYKVKNPTSSKDRDHLLPSSLNDLDDISESFFDWEAYNPETKQS